MPHAEMGSVPIVERYRFKNVAATIYEIPFVSELDEEDRASNKGDLLQERRRSRNSSLSLLENSEEDESRAINLPFFSKRRFVTICSRKKFRYIETKTNSNPVKG